MKFVKKLCIGILCAALLVVFHLFVAHPIANEIRRNQQSKANSADGAALHDVVAEAYINIQQDPNFVNTATDDAPMEVPEKYYTYVESVQGHGRVHVTVDKNGYVDAYFGSPEKTQGYYVDLGGESPQS